jgi:prepilin-type processing-associated H-X9-DG protein
VIDGTTNTLMFSELILAEDQQYNDLRGRYNNPAHGNVFFSTRHPPNSSVPDRLVFCSQDVHPPEAPCVIVGGSDAHLILARSYHRGGINACRADGSVDFIADDIDPATYRAMGSRDAEDIRAESVRGGRTLF